jgi:hypothetical protein
VKYVNDRDVDKLFLKGSGLIVSEKIEISNENCNIEQDTFFEADSELNPVQQVYPSMILDDSEVLGTTGSCRTPSFTYSTEDICTSDPSQFQMTYEKSETVEEGQNIPRNASVELVAIFQPTLSDGSRTVHSSDMQIRTKYEGDKKTDIWSFKAAGESIPTKVMKNNSEPSSANMGSWDIIFKADSSESKTYSTKYEISSGNDSANGEVVDEGKKVNDCEECSKNNPTPEKFNLLGTTLSAMENPPKYDSSKKIQEEEIKDCKSTDRFFNYGETIAVEPRGCVRSLGDVIITFLKRITSSDVNKCSDVESETNECVNTQNIVVKMSSNWGSEIGCEDGVCAEYYSYVRNSKTIEPSNNKVGKTYIVTPCYANVEGAGRVKLQCAWDYDYLTKDLEFQANDNIPGETYPGVDDFIEYNIEEDSARTDAERDLF